VLKKFAAFKPAVEAIEGAAKTLGTIDKTLKSLVGDPGAKKAADKSGAVQGAAKALQDTDTGLLVKQAGKDIGLEGESAALVESAPKIAETADAARDAYAEALKGVDKPFKAAAEHYAEQAAGASGGTAVAYTAAAAVSETAGQAANYIVNPPEVMKKIALTIISGSKLAVTGPEINILATKKMEQKAAAASMEIGVLKMTTRDAAKLVSRAMKMKLGKLTSKVKEIALHTVGDVKAQGLNGTFKIKNILMKAKVLAIEAGVQALFKSGGHQLNLTPGKFHHKLSKKAVFSGGSKLQMKGKPMKLN
jgi:hypothetical protein